MTDSVHRICAELGIEIVPTHKARKLYQTAAVKILQAIARDHGEGHLTMVLRVFAESEHNASELNQFSIYGVSDVLAAHPEWANAGLKLLDAFDRIHLGDLRERARANCIAVPQRRAMATMIYNELCSLSELASTGSERKADDEMATENDLIYGTPAIAKFLGLSIRVCRDLINSGAIPTFTMPKSSTRCARRSALNARWEEYETEAIQKRKAAAKKQAAA